MNRYEITIFDAITGVTVTREMTETEIAEALANIEESQDNDSNEPA